MQIRKFQLDQDLQLLETFLRNQYFENKNMSSWLPERLHDLIYRMGAQEADSGRERSMDYIFLWEENEEMIACILPDGENIYISIKNGFEYLFSSILAYSEKNCLPLFHKADDASVKFWVVAQYAVPRAWSATIALSRVGYYAPITRHQHTTAARAPDFSPAFVILRLSVAIRTPFNVFRHATPPRILYPKEAQDLCRFLSSASIYCPAHRNRT
jgi:hypothetical protein